MIDRKLQNSYVVAAAVDVVVADSLNVVVGDGDDDGDGDAIVGTPDSRSSIP
jgi:hypothetical protein